MDAELEVGSHIHLQSDNHIHSHNTQTRILHTVQYKNITNTSIQI